MTASSPSRPRRAAVLILGGVVALVAIVTGAAISGLIPAAFTGTASPAISAQPSAAATPSADVATPSPAATATPELTPAPSAPPSCAPAPVAAVPGAVPILYLHRVVAPPAAWLTWSADQRRRFLSYDVIPAAFAADLDWLKANGYTTILPRDLAAHWDHGATLPARPVVITLDDGNQSWVDTVLPMLRERGMVAEFYLTLDAIKYDQITWAGVQALADAGMGIGAHDVHHVQLANLGSNRPPASPDTMWYEVNQARIEIGRHIGVLPDSMAYVGGGFDATLVSLVRKAGYTTARSIIRGISQSEANRYTLRVVALAPRDDVLDAYAGTMACGVPTFVAKVTGQTH